MRGGPSRLDQPSPAPVVLPPGHTILVGRTRELKTLTQSLEVARRGQGTIVLIGGEPGIGKTRILTEAAERARRDGWRVLAGRAYDSEGMPPYLPFIEALGDWVRACPVEALRAQLGEGAPELALLLPEVRSRLPHIKAKSPLEPDSSRYRLFEGICSVLLSIARHAQGGLLLCLDDLHSADTSTLLLLQHLARKLANAALVVLATYRPMEIDRSHPLFDTLAELTRERLCQSLSLSRLSLEASAELIGRLAAGPVALAVVDAVHRKAEGNPFYIEELVRHLQAEGHDLADPRVALGDWSLPQGVRHVIGKRLSRLGPGTLRLLQAAAVLGERFSADLLGAVAGFEDAELAAVLEDAMHAGMLQDEGEGFRFTHALVRQTVYEEISLPRRQRLHLAAAQAIERAHAPSMEARIVELAVHYRRAGPAADQDRAIDFSVRAGGADGALCAYEEAAQHWQAALDLMDGRAGTEMAPAHKEERRARLLERLGHLLYTTGLDYQKGLDYLERALNLYSDLGRAQRQPGMQGEPLIPSPREDGPRELSRGRAVESALGPNADRAARGYVYMALAAGAMFALHTEQGLTVSRRAMQIASRLGNEALWATAAAQYGYHLVGAGRLGEAADLLEQAWETADQLNDVFAAWFAAWCGGICSFDLLDAPGAEAWFQRELSKPRLGQAPDQRLVLQEWVARARAEEGNLPSARAFLAGAASASGWVSSADPLENLQWSVPFRAGEWAEAQRRGIRGREACHSIGAWGPEAEWTRCQAQVHRARGDVAGAEALLREALALVEGDCLPSEIKARVELAILYAETGRPRDADPHLARCRQIMARGEHWRGLAGRIDLAEAARAAADGRPDGDAATFQQAIATFRAYCLSWDEADALACWGRTLLQAGMSSEAREKLEAAADISRCCGAGEEWVQSLFAPRRRIDRGGSHPNGLTEREVEVLRLLAAGRSSRQIAADLVLSVRTVERHISNIYGKIDARTRAQATAYALKHGIA